MYLTVPVREGPQYQLGTVSFAGNSVFSDDALRSQIPIQDGQVLNNGALEFGITRINNAYQDRGHLYANVVRRVERREGELMADVEVQIDEDEPYYVGRIDFAGNTGTQDRVFYEPAVVDQLFARLPGGRRLEVAEAGHMLPAETPDALIAALMDFGRAL